MASATETEQEAKPALRAPTQVRASLVLDFERTEANGHTVLANAQQEAPLQVVRAFPIEDGAALAHLHNVSGGLLGGDHLAFTIRVGAGARVQLTTTGASRIYRPRKEAPTTTQLSEITVGENALLEYLPDPIIPFAGARFYQQTRIHLARDAGLFWWEILAPGREAHGEAFQYERVEMKTDLAAIGRPIAAERIRLEPRNYAPSSLARLGPYRTWATFYICRVGLDASAWLTAEKQLGEVVERLNRPGQALWGVSALTAHGLVVRGLARHGRHALPGLHALWRAAKLGLYQRDAVPPRKVN